MGVGEEDNGGARYESGKRGKHLGVGGSRWEDGVGKGLGVGGERAGCRGKDWGEG